ncbi:hypothetical protein BJX68DRAFT_272009 [Aspergillus pseudodeflectus]|uniref:F-box domain-containing protein n=1 Tax=Aspergillus pseudodeflectus TaxID=176178 RepID=A0ABR4JI15_9EURO
MSDPSTQVAPVDRLPMEIWDQVLLDLMDVEYQLDPHPHLVTERFPAEICAVSRRWHQRFNPILYHRFDFKNLLREIKPLWCLLRTLVARPDLAALFREITMFSPRFPIDFTNLESPDAKQHMTDLCAQNVDMVRQAMIQARFDLAALPGGDLIPLATRYLSCDVNDLDRNYHLNHVAALRALVLAHVPKIEHLSLQTLANDPFLERILDVARAPRDRNSPGIAFQHLETLNVAPNSVRDPYLGSSRIIHNGQTVLSGKRQYHRLPKLTEFTLLEGRIEFNAVQHRTALKKLSLPEIQNYLPQVTPLLSLSSDLRQLSISSSYERGPVFHHKFWAAIAHLKDQLEYLDFFEAPYPYMPNQTRYFHEVDEKFSLCPPLPKFTKLRVLKTSPLVLYGHNCKKHETHDETQETAETPNKLASHMPRNLESLGLYVKRSAWMSTYIKELETELEGIVLDAVPRRKLTHIMVDNTDRVPFDKMRAAAEKHRIPFVGPRETMACGGRDTVFADQTRPGYCAAGMALNMFRHLYFANMIPVKMKVHSIAGMLENVHEWKRKRQDPPAFWNAGAKRARH